MGLIENLRQWTSERFDDITDQKNTYHRSSGKTQKEFEQDLKTYNALQAGLVADALLASTGLGLGLGAAGGSAAAGAATAGTAPSIIGDTAIALTNPAVVAPTAGVATGLGTLLPILGGAGGALTGLGLTGATLDAAGAFDSVDPASKSEGSDTTSEETGEQEKEETTEEETKSPDYDIDEMAGEFILGAWGNGQDRIDNMLSAGYTIDDYNKIQQRVNEAYASGRDLHEWTNKANEKLHYW